MPNNTLEHYGRSTSQWGADELWKEPYAVSIERPTFPFEGNITDYLVEQDFIIYTDYYLETIPDVGTENQKQDFIGFFFSHDSTLSDLGGGISRFTRTWAKLPGLSESGSVARTEFESFAYTKPGINNSVAVITYYIDSSSTSSLDGSLIQLKSFQNFPHNIGSEYQMATVYYNFAQHYTTANSAVGITYIFPGIYYTTPIISRTTTSITVATLNLSGSATNYLGFSKPVIKINPKTEVVNSKLEFTYWLPGVNCESPDTIPLEQIFQIKDENSNFTDTLSEITTPSLATYQSSIAGQYIVAEGSTVRRWNGNIYERTTRKVRALSLTDAVFT